MAKKKNIHPLDTRGGVIVTSRAMLESQPYLALSAQAKVLMMLMHSQWRPDRPIGYGVREAMEKIPCAKGTAQKAFDELESAGFIKMIDHSLFIDRIRAKARTWQLNWMPYMGRRPSHDWERKASNIQDIKPQQKNDLTVPKTHPVDTSQGQKRTPNLLQSAPQGQKCTL
ncbi:MAG: hypothetical protein Q7W55_09660 [Pseudohongiella sp.]|nr:hypothetical protein [Pseudohongiella sp.]